MTFGENLRAERERLGLTRELFAEGIGKSASFVYDLETGKSNPSVDTLTTVVAALKIPADTLLFGEREKEDYSHITRHLEGMTEQQLEAVEAMVKGMRKLLDLD